MLVWFPILFLQGFWDTVQRFWTHLNTWGKDTWLHLCRGGSVGGAVPSRPNGLNPVPAVVTSRTPYTSCKTGATSRSVELEILSHGHVFNYSNVLRILPEYINECDAVK